MRPGPLRGDTERGYNTVLGGPSRSRLFGLREMREESCRSVRVVPIKFSVMSFDSVGRDGERLASAEQAIGPYLRAIRRHWKLVVAVTLLAGVIAGYTASHGGKTYQASSSILVSPLPEGQSSTLGIDTVVDTGDPARTIQTAAALIDTQQAAQAAAKILRHRGQAGEG